MVSQSTLFRSTNVSGVRTCTLPIVNDHRGSLAFAEYESSLPFVVRRVFFVFDVPAGETRGNHAHKSVHQLLVCVKGCCSITVDDGRTRENLRLEHPTMGVHLPPRVWASQHEFSPDAVLLVLSSDNYDPNEYIRDYEEFLKLAAGR
jgi:dTDP-4-dehydrorhamnose 3,5-epimerase-like enzyme